MRLKINLLILILLYVFLSGVYSQNDSSEANLLVKTNILYDLTGTINLGVEYKISNKVSTELSANLNPWDYGSWKIKHFLLQPGVRYWLNHTYDHAFFGVHLMYSKFDFAGLKLPFGIYGGFDLNDYRYKGIFYGIGISTGYQWHFHRNWGMEASFGIGYTYWDYDKFDFSPDAILGPEMGESGGLFSLTKLGLSLIYKIN